MADRPAVVMYVFNDATHDSRVRREAATLAAAGHDVTLIAIAGRDLPEREQVDGFALVRVPVPDAWRADWPSWIKPGLRRTRELRAARAALTTRPRSLRAAVSALRAAATWTLVSIWRRIALALPRRLGGVTAWPPANLHWLLHWRGSILAWGRAAAAAAPVAAVHHGHDLTGLPAARRAAARDRARLVYDSHEIYPDSGRNAERPRWARSVLRVVEGRWTRGMDALVSVNAAYARVIERRTRAKRTVVVHNCPPAWTPAPGDGAQLRALAGVPDGSPLVLYHGAFTRYRGMEQLAEAMLDERLARAHLVFLGYGGSRPVLDGLAADPRFAGRIHVLDAVPPDELLALVSGADVDAIPLQHSSLNHWLCTPNKLFESLTAGVPVVVSDFPVMHGIVLDDPAGPLGGVCDPDDPGSIAGAISAILDRPDAEREALRERCRTAARERWNWETESARLVALYADLVSAGPRP